MTSNQDPTAPLRDVAQNPEAFARYLADLQRHLLDIGSNLEVLQREVRVHCRGTHIEGDRWYHARMRAVPVEKALKDVLRHLNGLTQGLEKSAYKRMAHDDAVKALPQHRKDKALEKARKKNPGLQAVPEFTGQVPAAPVTGYSGPTSISDLRRDWSA